MWVGLDRQQDGEACSLPLQLPPPSLQECRSFSLLNQARRRLVSRTTVESESHVQCITTQGIRSGMTGFASEVHTMPVRLAFACWNSALGVEGGTGAFEGRDAAFCCECVCETGAHPG